MRRSPFVLAVLALALSVTAAPAQGPKQAVAPVDSSAPRDAASLDSVAQAEAAARAEFLAKLQRKSGRIELDGGFARLDLPATVDFLDPRSAKLLIEDGWGNPPGTGSGLLGMIIPANLDPLSEESWGIAIQFNDDGYVSDKDAKEIDFTALLKEMQDATEESNELRAKEGYPPVRLLGWAEPPTYDATTHKLYWAKELEFGGDSAHTLNYAVRILGRRGVLELSAIAGMNQLDIIRGEVQQLLPAVEFNEGHRYADYVEGSDKVATYGLTALVAGAVATKAGFFKVLFAGLLAAKKFLVIGAIALFAGARKLFAKKAA